MKAAEIRALFPTEASLCDTFAQDLRELGGWTVYPETAGFDLLCVRDDSGHQLGVEAKLALNAKVADQILPPDFMGFREGVPGPDFRAVLVPYLGDASAGIAKMLTALGVQVFAPMAQYAHRARPSFSLTRHGGRDHQMYDTADGPLLEWDLAWFDWNPPQRCELPEIVPAVRAGVPAPLRLTPWKIGALRVLADLEINGFVTAKSVRAHSVDARRFCASDGWLIPLGEGRWGRGTVPAFDLQHPEVYQQVLAEARKRKAGEA